MLTAIIFFYLIVFLLRIKSHLSLANTHEGLIRAHVKWVLDGDTVDVSWPNGEVVRIRLTAIDCPEDGQEWGDIATYGLVKLIGGRVVYLERDGIDFYGRTLATIYVEEECELINVNEKMVARGHAWVLRQFRTNLSDSRKDQLDRLEEWARSKRVGLWKAECPIPPWEWRFKKGA